MKKLSDLNLEYIKLVAFDFDGVFTDNRVTVDENGKESVVCSREDGLGLRKLDNLDIYKCIISSEKNKLVTKRAKKLGIDCFHAVENKACTLQNLSIEKNIDLKNVLFLGNDINDIPAFKIVGFPVGVFDSNEEINQSVICYTEKKGGKGAVREVCDKIYSSQSNE
tara:strand:- start:37 stop:534 length:498 start_codon:yes stop_codon:yes gene_type:complete